MKYIYPAVFHIAEEGGYWVDFPDLEGCFTEGDTFIEAYKMAEEAMSEYIISCENDKVELKKASDIESIDTEQGDIINLISADTVKYRKEISDKTVKKTLTIPAWLNEMALNKNLNFSKVLQKALKIELEIE